ncbi:hypothetical protein CVT26_007214 [Gymnopilus dilepis]|uniref:Uncharacterized protein n=1 Tax=Gymnopilus dilepis TaxID=231916 RepID=A0A409W6Y5_9AGAR|nr:hypothetical protein CVT26_007214 [Gymnopilus dilepis]
MPLEELLSVLGSHALVRRGVLVPDFAVSRQDLSGRHRIDSQSVNDSSIELSAVYNVASTGLYASHPISPAKATRSRPEERTEKAEVLFLASPKRHSRRPWNQPRISWRIMILPLRSSNLRRSIRGYGFHLVKTMTRTWTMINVA